MSITNPSPNVLINGFPATDGVDVLVTDATTAFQLEDAAGVNVWTLECIGADEINTPFLTTINSNLTYVDGTNRTMQNNTIRGVHATALATGTALIFRSTVNNGVDINGNLRDDYVTTIGVFILTDDTYDIPNNDLRVGAENETIEGSQDSGWTGKLNEVIRLVGQPILAHVDYPGIIKLAGDLEGTGLVPRVGKLQGHPFEPHPEADQVFVAPFGTYDIEWRYLVNANIDPNAAIAVSKLASGSAGQVLVNNAVPTPQWMTIDGDISISSVGTSTLEKIRGKNTATALASIGASEDGYVLKWDNSNTEWNAFPDTGGGSSVSWAGDLLGSTDVTQVVTHISGSTGGVFGSGRGVDLGNGVTDFVMFPQLIGSGTPPTFYLSGTPNSSGNGGDFIISAGGGSGGSNVGGDLKLRSGTGATNNTGGEVSIVYLDAFSVEYTLASFTRTGTTIEAAAHTATASLDLNSGTGGTAIYSDGDIGITASSNVTVATAAGAVNINAKTSTYIKSDSDTHAQFDTDGRLILGRPDTTAAYHILSFTDSDETLSYTQPHVQQTLSTTHHGNALWIKGQDTTGGAYNGGPLMLCGGLSNSATDGYVLIRTGNTVRMQVATTGTTIYDLGGSGSGYVAVDNNGLLSFTATANPGGSAGGDLTGTYPNPTVAKIRTKTLASALSSIGASQDGYVLTWDDGDAEWQAKPSSAVASAVTWDDDLSGSTDLHQFISSISGNAGGGGTVTLNIDTFEWAEDQAAPTISQVATSAASGQDLLIQAQSATGGANDGGDIILDGGNSGSSIPGWIRFRSGTVPICFIDKFGLTFEENAGPGVAINQIVATSGDGADWGIAAQSASLGDGGDLMLSSGVGGGGGASGVLVLAVENYSATKRITLNAAGAVRFHTYGAGLIHSDSSGNLTSSALVNADVDASAAIAVSKLAAGTSAQVLLNSATPTPTWTTFSQDATVSSTGAITVSGLRTKSLASALSSIGASQDGYVLTWVNGSSEWQAKPATGSGSGLTAPVTASHRAISGSYTVDSSGNDYVLLVSTAAARNITLPTPTSGRVLVIKDSTGQAETNNITVVRAASEQIDGVAASRVLSTNWGQWTLMSDGTNWFFI